MTLVLCTSTVKYNLFTIRDINIPIDKIICAAFFATSRPGSPIKLIICGNMFEEATSWYELTDMIRNTCSTIIIY